MLAVFRRSLASPSYASSPPLFLPPRVFTRRPAPFHAAHETNMTFHRDRFAEQPRQLQQAVLNILPSVLPHARLPGKARLGSQLQASSVMQQVCVQHRPQRLAYSGVVTS
jgi:hypothetical protein